MNRTTAPYCTLPARAGVSLKPAHAERILAEMPDIGWFEVHAENYMGAGGPPHAMLAAIAERWPISIHGVGLSIGGSEPLDPDHLERLALLVERCRPAAVSEHLAWSSHGGVYYNDLLPLPWTTANLRKVVEHVGQLQDRLGRRILLENPSSYIAFAESTMAEVDFLAEIARRSGCGLLLDVNNVYVSATNLGFDAGAFLAAFPMQAVGEIHLAGHTVEQEADGGRLLLDTHDHRVADEVWALYGDCLARSGPIATLIEWDKNLPDLSVLLAEAALVEQRLQGFGGMRYARPR